MDGDEGLDGVKKDVGLPAVEVLAVGLVIPNVGGAVGADASVGIDEEQVGELKVRELADGEGKHGPDILLLDVRSNGGRGVSRNVDGGRARVLANDDGESWVGFNNS